MRRTCSALTVLVLALACARIPPPPDVAPDGDASDPYSPEAEAERPPPEACADRSPADCGDVGAVTLMTADPQGAEAMLEWSCANGYGQACSNLAVAYRSEILPAPEAGALLELDRRGCDLDSTPSCRMLGVDYYEGEQIGQDFTQARALFDASCEQSDAQSCVFLGLMIHEGQGGASSPVASAGAFERACELGEAEGCKNAGVLHLGGDAGGGAAKAQQLFETGAALDDAESCYNLGVMFAQGMGVAQDAEVALGWMARACELGDQDGCGAAEQLAASLDPNAVANANVSMGSIEVDGMTIEDVQCRISGGGGLFGTMALLATLSKKKKAFDKCAPKGAKPVVRWNFVGSATEVINVDDPSDKVAACVEKVMKTVPPSMEAECRATLVIGKQ